MRLGLAFDPKAESPEAWAEELAGYGCKAASLPCDYKEDIHIIDRYRDAAKAHDIMIAEVGAWCNPLSPDPEVAKAAMERCIEQLKLADYIGAGCCCNITGADGPVWDAYYPGNYSPDFYKKTVESLQTIIDKAAPTRTVYAIEPMPWMVPSSPEEYLKLIDDVDSKYMGVHLDMVNWMNGFDRFHNQHAFMDHVFELLHGKIDSCHFKDCYLKQELTFEIKECPIGEGGFDIDYYVKKINEENPNLPLMIEHLETKEQYLKSMEFVKARYYG